VVVFNINNEMLSLLINSDLGYFNLTFHAWKFQLDIPTSSFFRFFGLEKTKYFAAVIRKFLEKYVGKNKKRFWRQKHRKAMPIHIY
jgi:hypothetical protein